MTIPWYKAPATEEKAAPGQQEQPCGAAYFSSLSALCFGELVTHLFDTQYFKELSLFITINVIFYQFFDLLSPICIFNFLCPLEPKPPITLIC